MSWMYYEKLLLHDLRRILMAIRNFEKHLREVVVKAFEGCCLCYPILYLVSWHVLEAGEGVKRESKSLKAHQVE